MKPGSSIINTSSIAAYRPYGIALDYEASKGAVAAFTASLARSLLSRGIRVNSVAPGYVFLASDESSYMTGQALHIYA